MHFNAKAQRRRGTHIRLTSYEVNAKCLRFISSLDILTVLLKYLLDFNYESNIGAQRNAVSTRRRRDAEERA